jgi:hypothetical protein
VSITLPPAAASAAEPEDRRSAWFAASRRRLGLTEGAWYDPAVEHVLDALDRDEPIHAAVVELGHARGQAGFDLRETATDLAALAEILPVEVADRLHVEDTVAALSAWSDAFIDRVHPPAFVDAATGLATVAYLRIRLVEVHRECDERGLLPSEAYALVVTGPIDPPPTPLARLAGRMRAGRCTRTRFPGGETACHLDGQRVAVLAPNDDRLAARARGLAADLIRARDGILHIEALSDRLQDSQRRLDELTMPTIP